MTIRNRGRGYQLDVSVTREGRKTRYREQFTGSKIEAQAREWQIRAALAEGRDPSPITATADEETLAEAYHKTFERFWDGTRSETVARSNASIIQESLGPATPLKDVGVEQIDALVSTWRAKGHTSSTINRRLTSINKVLSHAVDRGTLDIKPKISFLKETAHRVRYFTPEERSMIVSYWSTRGDQKWSDYFTILLDTGMRPSELDQIETRDINLESGSVRIWKTKTDRPRTVPLTQRALEAFTRQTLNERPFAFSNTAARTKKWNAIREELGLSDDPDFVSYACRHDCATRLLQATGNIVLVQNWLGHTDIKMTMRYAHLVPDTLSAGLSALEKQNAQEEGPPELLRDVVALRSVPQTSGTKEERPGQLHPQRESA